MRFEETGEALTGNVTAPPHTQPYLQSGEIFLVMNPGPDEKTPISRADTMLLTKADFANAATGKLKKAPLPLSPEISWK